MHLGLVPMGYAWLGLPYDEDTGFADHVGIESWLSAYVSSDPVQVQSLLFDTYLAVGSTDLTGKLYDLRKFGFAQKIKDYPIPGSRKTIKIHQGAEGPGYSFSGTLTGRQHRPS
jgi:hypothetical protein